MRENAGLGQWCVRTGSLLVYVIALVSTIQTYLPPIGLKGTLQILFDYSTELLGAEII